MDIFDTLSYRAERPCVVALGCFDGVHIGHQAVIKEAKLHADKLALPLCVFTFAKPPKSYFSKEPIPQVCSIEDKFSLLEMLGVDILISVQPSKEIFSMTAESFVRDFLLTDLKAKHVVCGFNYTFGVGGTGNTSLLQKICEANGATVSICPQQKVGDVTVSSSLIRDAVSAGQMDVASGYLGRQFSITSDVISGQHLARKLGFPTVNIIPQAELVLPKNGVYVTRVMFDDQTRYGITNVGLRPTVDTHILCAETHLFDFEGDIYGKKITVEFLKFIRAETKFPSVQAMAQQVRLDIEAAKKYLGN
ncbi:MAG: bifunctional riboflavin kinase/FAD synthetase [Ruminococcaceae bacterium]|nr:bifunctional riboflavin kinase/FAD synthetase [Oscillospiraceae bacterium]